MTAEEMFRRLGFTKKITPNTLITYGCVNTTASRDIAFDKVSRRIAVKDVLGNKLTTEAISVNELMAIIQQCIELGWLEEETCTNKLEYDSRDVFKCSNCGFISVHQTGVKSDEDNRVEFFYSYKPKYCPNCGSKIID
jgi:predicted RNA-binding Zn-ribbon protein involved in translation (DUF1610 family)|nr:MAG TPA: zinc-ribbon domain protein [Caudoviricetes sp.]